MLKFCNTNKYSIDNWVPHLRQSSKIMEFMLYIFNTTALLSNTNKTRLPHIVWSRHEDIHKRTHTSNRESGEICLSHHTTALQEYSIYKTVIAIPIPTNQSRTFWWRTLPAIQDFGKHYSNKYIHSQKACKDKSFLNPKQHCFEI